MDNEDSGAEGSVSEMTGFNNQGPTDLQQGHGACDPGDTTENTAEDSVDGFFIKTGKYKPRQIEKEEWGIPSTGQFVVRDDAEASVLYLLKVTSADLRWRRPLKCLLADSVSDIKLRQNLLAMLQCLQAAITTSDHGDSETSVHLEHGTPDMCSTWRSVLTEVGLDLNFQSQEPKNVTVRLAPGSDVETLRGFHHLLLALKGVSPTNHNNINRLRDEEGQQLLTVLAYLEAGRGIDHLDRPFIDEISTRFPYLMTSLGFREVSDGRRQWERHLDVEKQQQYRNLFTTFHGLFLDMQTMRTDL